MPKFRIYVNTGFVNCNYIDIIEIDDTEWNSMSDIDREAILDEAGQELLNTHIEYGYEEI